MRKTLKIISILLYIICISAILCGIAVYCIHTFAFNGVFTRYLALEPVYYYYEPLVDDYISLLKNDKPATALSCIEPRLIEYYCSIYKLNKDIIMTLDDAYASDMYEPADSWMIHHTIEWNVSVYQDTWDKLSVIPDRGVDLYVRLYDSNDSLLTTLIFEVIHRDSSWYLLSVTPE